MDQAGIVRSQWTYQQLGLVVTADAKADLYPPWTNGTGAMYFKFREPVMAETLDYYSTRTGIRP